MNTNNPVDIAFVDDRGKQDMIEVQWYHVPRVGDHIEIAEPSPMFGRVVVVTWMEDSVEVRVK